MLVEKFKKFCVILDLQITDFNFNETEQKHRLNFTDEETHKAWLAFFATYRAGYIDGLNEVASLAMNKLSVV